jgi:lipid II:glycine glycyltransferase (peptidoglycan interpeptide bridge formation enzyme)
MKKTTEKVGEIPKYRIDAMDKLGLKYDGVQYGYKDINFHWTDLLTMSDAAFEKAIKGASKRMAELALEPDALIGAGGLTLVQETLPHENRLTDVLAFMEALKAVKPRTKEQAIKYIHAISAIMSAEKSIKTACYDFLDTRCADCEEHEADGLKVKYIQNEMKVYNPSKEVEKAEKALEQAKEDLQAARDKAGFKLKPGASYWKAVR